MSRLLTFSRSKLIWAGLGLVILWAVSALFIPGKILIEIGDAFVLPMALVASFIYGQKLLGIGAKRQIIQEEKHLNRVDILIFAISGMWLMNYVDRGWRLWARLFDIQLGESPVIALFLTLMTYFAALHLLVRGSEAEQWRWTRGARLIAWALLASAFLVSYVLYVNFVNDSWGNAYTTKGY